MANVQQLEAGYQAARQPQQQAQAPKGNTGLLGKIASSITAAPKYFLNTDIINPGKELAAQVTGNQKAYQNAQKSQTKTIGKTPLEATKRLAGNTVGLATTVLAPEAKAGFLGRLTQGAKIGATAGAGGALADNGNAEDVVKGALTGGAFGGALGGTAGALSKGASKVGDLAEGRAASKAEKTTEKTRIVNEEPFKGVSKKVLQNNDLQGTLQHMQSLGVEPTPENLKSFSSLVTGDNGIVSGTVRQLPGNVGHVSTAGVIDDAHEAALREAGQLGNVEDKGGAAAGVLRSIRNTIQGTALKGEGSLTDRADANDAFDAVKSLEGRIQDLGGTRATGTNGAEARILQSAANSLKEKIGNEADATVKAHTLGDEDISAIRDAVKKAGGGDEVANHIINGINKASSLGELRSLQKPFVNASELADAAEKTGAGSLTKPTKEQPGIVGDVTNIGTNLALGNHFGIAQNAGRAAQRTGILDKVLGGTENAVKSVSGATSAVPGSFLNRIIATGGRVDGMSAPESGQAQPTTDVSSIGNELQNDLTPPAPTDDNGEPTIDKGTLLALIAADPKNSSTYISLYTLFNKDSATNATRQKATAAAKNAENTLGQISSSFESAGGGQGKIGGTVANIEGKLGLNSNAATYNDTATALAASLYKALGNTGTISDRDQVLIANLIPKTTDTDTTARAKISQLDNLLQQAEQNTIPTAQ